MTRRRPETGRTTRSADANRDEPDIPPLYRRRPGVFVFIMVATLAMVLTTMAGIIDFFVN